MRNKHGKSGRAGPEAKPRDDTLTQAQLREIKRRVKDLEDRTRYLLVSRLGRRFALYYNVSEDTYAMNEPAFGTLFKRRAAALAVERLLGGHVQVVPCRVDRSGRLIQRSAPPLRSRNLRRRRAPANKRSQPTKGRRTSPKPRRARPRLQG